MPRAHKDKVSGLSEKQERFCVLYITDEKLRGNATSCYIEAFKTNGSRRTAEKRGSELLALGEIQGRLTSLRDAVAEKASITAAETLEIAAAMARAMLSDYYNDDGTIKPPSEWTREMKIASASLKTFEEYSGKGKGEDRQFDGLVRELKIWDKNHAVERLFKHFGLFDKDNKQRAVTIQIVRHGSDSV